MSVDQVFGFFWGASETIKAGVGAETGAEAEAGARASRTALKILYKSSSEYSGTLVAATGTSAMGSFLFEGLAGWFNNLSLDLGGREETRGATEEATKAVTEGRS